MVSGVIGLRMTQIMQHLTLVQVKTMQLPSSKEIQSGMMLMMVILEIMAM